MVPHPAPAISPFTPFTVKIAMQIPVAPGVRESGAADR
jgi:hypothetical protein